MHFQIAWTFNIRGSDIAFNPVVFSYAVVTTTDAHLFIDSRKISPEVEAHLAAAHVILHPYSHIQTFLEGLTTASVSSSDGEGAAEAQVHSELVNGVLVDPTQLNWRLHSSLGAAARDVVSPIAILKSVKNPAEIDGIVAAHVRDGAALTAFLHWLGNAVRAAPATISEYDVTELIEGFRQKVPGHVSPSFK